MAHKYYNTPTPLKVEKTFAELKAETSDAILATGIAEFNKFQERHLFLDRIVQKIVIHPVVAAAIWDKSVEIEQYCSELMNDRIVDIPEVINDGVVTPATYIPAPASLVDLKKNVKEKFKDVLFKAAQIELILDNIMGYSKHDGTGNWNYYKTAVKGG